ncbi:hypothetical protein ANN_22696 [Periplaneta americana]|uniref:Uncharacterized protein n=1 Tax=Periplaneta americana TaxID=6978 RepID=A0ABQ8S917_PERAM|nr:hypothetical protein ANN_22696 [Periplaneta americana]
MTFINNDPNLPNFKKTSLHNILLEMGFECVQRNRKIIIVDSEDISLLRIKYLSKVREYRRNGQKQAFLSELTTGLKNPTGEVRRLILLHIVSEDSFVEGREFIVKSKKMVDYHEEMSGDVFINLFKGILPSLASNKIQSRLEQSETNERRRNSRNRTAPAIPAECSSSSSSGSSSSSRSVEEEEGSSKKESAPCLILIREAIKIAYFMSFRHISKTLTLLTGLFMTSDLDYINIYLL